MISELPAACDATTVIYRNIESTGCVKRAECRCLPLCSSGKTRMVGSMLQACNLRSGIFTSGRPVARSSKLCLTRRGRPLCAQVRADNVLIANTKGGGHAFIGLHLAKQLLDSGHSVTILNDGDEVRSVHTQLCLTWHVRQQGFLVEPASQKLYAGQKQRQGSIQPV